MPLHPDIANVGPRPTRALARKPSDPPWSTPSGHPPIESPKGHRVAAIPVCSLRRNAPPSSPRSSYTLVEILLATALTAVLVIIFWTFFTSTTRVSVHQSEYMQSMAEVLRIWHVLQEDLLTARNEGDDRPVILNEKILDSLQLLHVPAEDFGAFPRLVSYLAIPPADARDRPPLKPSPEHYGDVRVDHVYKVYRKVWKPVPLPVWPHNDWPPWFHDLDDDVEPHRRIDPGLRFGFLPGIENVVELVEVPPAVKGRPETTPVFVCIRRPQGVTVWAYHPYDRDGNELRRLLRYSPADGTTTLSEGFVTGFQVRPIIEVTPHPQDKLQGLDEQKLFFDVALSATADAAGRSIAPRPFAMQTVVVPPYPNQEPFVRWLDARP